MPYIVQIIVFLCKALLVASTLRIRNLYLASAFQHHFLLLLLILNPKDRSMSLNIISNYSKSTSVNCFRGELLLSISLSLIVWHRLQNKTIFNFATTDLASYSFNRYTLDSRASTHVELCAQFATTCSPTAYFDGKPICLSSTNKALKERQ